MQIKLKGCSRLQNKLPPELQKLCYCFQQLHWLILFTHSSIHPSIHPSTWSFLLSFVPSFIPTFVPSFVPLLIGLFVCLFACLFVHYFFISDELYEDIVAFGRPSDVPYCVLGERKLCEVLFRRMESVYDNLQ